MAMILMTRPVSDVARHAQRCGHTVVVCDELWQVLDALSKIRFDAVVANPHESELDAGRLAAFIHSTGLYVPFVTLRAERPVQQLPQTSLAMANRICEAAVA